jgi:hypothetical protein
LSLDPEHALAALRPGHRNVLRAHPIARSLEYRYPTAPTPVTFPSARIISDGNRGGYTSWGSASICSIWA